ncbi:MAG: hypothetical protein JTT11_02330 [Candidatus Brockarchaeota archaeon]|nr:hypothetical protein [Candidatus Brockarchaeota archaeon]
MADAVGLRLRKALGLRRPAKHYIEKGELSGLGDAVVNYIASVSETIRGGIPTGKRVDNETLVKSVRESGLREKLAHRKDKHSLGDAAETLIAYAWVTGAVTLDECVETLLRSPSLQDGLTRILRLAIKKAGVT